LNSGIEWALKYFIDTPFAVEPWTTYNYTTFGFNLVGSALQKAHGGKFEDMVRAAIFEKTWNKLPSLVPDKVLSFFFFF